MSTDIARNRTRSMMGLSHGEQLVVWAIRKIVAQQGVDPNLPAEFEAAFGAQGEEGLQIFSAFSGCSARPPENHMKSRHLAPCW